MNGIGGILSETWIQALGWTLLHSLWQGALAALALAVLMIFFGRFSSQGRYVIATIAMALVLGMSVMTFLRSYSGEIRGRVVVVQTEPAPTAALLDPDETERIAKSLFQETGFWGRAGSFFGRYFQRHFPLLVTLWLGGFLIYFLRLLGGYAYNQWLKAYQTRPVTMDWPVSCREMMTRKKTAKHVRLLESARAKAPMVIGQLKPAILLPIGLLTGLPQEQIEAILVHELAHIVRRDYLVNLLQSFMEILYFFHPGVRWISAVIRREREHCCDDLVVSASGDSAHLARALVQIQARSQAVPVLDVSLLGHREKLIDRVKRLIDSRKLRTDSHERLAAGCVLFAGVLALMVAARASDVWTISETPQAGEPVSPRAAGGPGTVPGLDDPASNVFEMAQDGRVEVIGYAEVQGGAGPEMRSWIIEGSTGKVVWRLSPEAVRRAPDHLAFRDIVSLKKGRYQWFFSRNDLTILKVLGKAASPEPAGGPSAEPKLEPKPETEKDFLSSEAVGAGARLLDFRADWKGRPRRIRAVIDQGRVRGFALDNITFLRSDIERNWDFIVRVLGEHERHQYAYKPPRGPVVNPRDDKTISRRPS